MHIPDGFLDPAWCVATYAITVAYFVLGYVRYRNRASLDPQTASLLITLSAGIFVAQMLNWPIPGGTSLHLVGAALAAALLGPYLGSVALALVLLVQCLVFHDGGITTLGANILNMGIVGVLSGYYISRAVVKLMGGLSKRSIFIGGLLGGWLSIFLAGVVCGIEIGFSPSFPYGVAVTVPIMGSWHFALGVIEGIITGSILSYIYSRDPNLIKLGV